ncbi:phospho-acceptor domain-containing protein [Sphingobacterium alimentarium]|uniref:histidine kinase n=1 Tax=Sphingobacterium alimentarium TaxID=797292 RepID=A0A4R3VUL5_9SPHI|nr:HAMP domain-containing sensor histidine kinase [Sphingobacterium alimentarium]TCV18624.1 phospho-acceptor domain-containing protein [Sphingobacterium alimentarium]
MNYNLINELKNTIENIRELEFKKFREAEKSDYILYKYNINKFRIYAIIALGVIILMLLFIIYYQYVVSKIERKLTKEKIYASQLAEEKTNLLANISHEIRTPLNSLKSVIKLLSSNEKEDIDKKLLINIEYDINNINNTVNDILNLSKIESNALPAELDDVYISRIIDDTVGLHRYQAEQKGLQLVNENMLDPMLMISSNEFTLRQIISNLVSNALKYTPKGSIRVVSKIVKNKIIIDVIDTGEGIPEDQLDQIFRKYYTVDGERAKIGFGLGLHISELLAKQIGGKLLVKSQLGVGSVFSLKIPFTQARKKNSGAPATSNVLPVETSILVVDDIKSTCFWRNSFSKIIKILSFLRIQKKRFLILKNIDQCW